MFSHIENDTKENHDNVDGLLGLVRAVSLIEASKRP